LATASVKYRLTVVATPAGSMKAARKAAMREASEHGLKPFTTRLPQTQEPEKDGTPAEASVPPIKQR
jgi:hypothetical protein